MEIAVVGAGLAGLSAAKALQSAGHQVTVYEKSRGLGGRLANKRLDWGTFDIGAQYFTVKSDCFRKEVERWQKAGVVKPWSFSPYTMDKGELVASPDNNVRYTGLPTMNGIAHFLAADLRVNFQAHVEQLHFKKGGWALSLADGTDVEGIDWVIVSSPAEQSKNLLSGCSDLAEKIPETLHTPCWALALETSGDVPLDIQGIFGDEVVSWVSRQSAKPGDRSTPGHHDLWVLHFSPTSSLAQGKNTTKDLAAVGVEWLENAFQKTLQVHNHYRHYWRYANLMDSQFSSSYLVDESQQLAVVGAWCCGGRVEGAYLSSYRMIQDCFC